MMRAISALEISRRIRAAHAAGHAKITGLAGPPRPGSLPSSPSPFLALPCPGPPEGSGALILELAQIISKIGWHHPLPEIVGGQCQREVSFLEALGLDPPVNAPHQFGQILVIRPRMLSCSDLRATSWHQARFSREKVSWSALPISARWHHFKLRRCGTDRRSGYSRVNARRLLSLVIDDGSTAAASSM